MTKIHSGDETESGVFLLNTLIDIRIKSDGPGCLIAPVGRLYPQKKNCGKCQSGIINHPNGQNAVLITYCTGDWLAKFGFIPACIDNCNLSYHGSAQQLCNQGRNDILVRGGCRPC